MSERRTPAETAILHAVENAQQGIRVAIPGKVVKWDASKQQANIQILVKDVTENESGDRVAKTVPVVTGVPVQFPGAGNYRVTFPISDGNTTIDGSVAPSTMGTLFFSHRSLDKWLSGSGGEVDPEFDHFHAPNDAIFMPGLRPFGNALSNVATDHMTAGNDADTGVQIHFHADKVVLGDENTAEFMFLCETLLGDLKSAATTLNTILLAGTTGGPTAQQITQAAQWALTQFYIRLNTTPSPYLSSKWKNK